MFWKISQNWSENTHAQAFIENILRRRCFPVNFGKDLRIPLFIERLWWLLLDVTGRGFCNEKIWLLHILLIRILQSSDREHLCQILKAILKLISCVLTSSHYTKPVIKSLEKNSLLETYKPILQLLFKYFHPQTRHTSNWLLSLCTRNNYLFI